MGTWQENMQATVSGGASAIQKEIDRASAIVASGKGTDATTRYINQMNALKDGHSLSKVVSGSMDNYKREGSVALNYKNTGSPDPRLDVSSKTPSYGTPEWYDEQVRLEQQFNKNVEKNNQNGDYSYQEYLKNKSDTLDKLNQDASTQASGGEDQWFEYAKKGFLALIAISVLGIVTRMFSK